MTRPTPPIRPSAASLDLGQVLVSADLDDDLEQEATLCSVEARLFGGPRRVSIGRYQLRERLGRGGVGDVYLAHDPMLHRDVALKLLRPEQSSGHAQARRRFIKEARAIAKLSHPNVLDVFDVGEFSWSMLPSSERPQGARVDHDVFIVMECIRGETLRIWLERTRPAWSVVLEHFVLAGRGVAAAHARGIVHRDFKPSNVLVSEQGAVKVIDFGLAQYGRPDDHAAQPQPGDPPRLGVSAPDGTVTRTGAVVGTPLYMSPEQHAGAPIGPAADQFAFCAALYEALYGHPAYQGVDAQALHRAKRHGPQVPPWPTPVPRTIGRAVIRGLSPRPRDRWPTFEALLHALTPRFRPRRVRRGLGLGIGVMGAFVAMSPTPSSLRVCDPDHLTSWVWNDDRRGALHARMQQAGADDVAQLDRDLDTRVDSYLQGWGQRYRSICNEGTSTPAPRQRMLGCLSQQLEQLDTVLALAMREPGTMGRGVNVLWSLPSPDECEMDGVAAAAEPDRDPQALRRLEQLRRGAIELRTLHRAGLYYAGIVRGLELVASAEASSELPITAGLLLELGELQRAAGDARAAARSLERAYFIASQIPDPPLVARAAVGVLAVRAGVLASMEAYEQWMPHARAALERSPDPALEAATMEVEAQVLALRSKFDEAIALSRRAIALRLRTDDPLVHAQGYSRLGTVLGLAHQAGLGLVETQRAAELVRTTVGEDHPRYAAILFNLGIVRHRAGELGDGLPDLRRSHEIQQRAFGRGNILTLRTQEVIAVSLLSSGQVEEGAPLLAETVALAEASLGLDDPRLLSMLTNLANMYQVTDRLPDAIRTHERVLALARVHPEYESQRRLALLNLSGVLVRLERHEEALLHLERALALHREQPFAPMREALLYTRFAECLIRQGEDLTRAHRFSRQAIAVAEAMGPVGGTDVGRIVEENRLLLTDPSAATGLTP